MEGERPARSATPPMEDLSPYLREANRFARETGDPWRDDEDLAQEAVTRLWQRVRGRAGSDPAFSLVRHILRGLRVDRLRRRCREVSEVVEPASSSTPLKAALQSEQQVEVRRAIAALPALQREVVKLRFYDGLKFREIAERLGAPLNTVLARMHRATHGLRRHLEDDDV